MSKIFKVKYKLWKRSIIQILSNFTMFIKQQTICILLHNFVKMETFIICYKENVNLKKMRLKYIWNKSWKELNIFIWMELFIETWSQQIFSWKIISVKSVTLDLLKIYRMIIQLWNQLLVLLFICHHNCWRNSNIQINQIYGLLDWFIMKCFMEEPPGQLQIKFNLFKVFTQKNHHSSNQSQEYQKTSF